MTADGYEDNEFGSQTPGERSLSDRSSIFTFTNAFEAATKDIFDNAGNAAAGHIITLWFAYRGMRTADK
jgi:hypothetical protein